MHLQVEINGEIHVIDLRDADPRAPMRFAIGEPGRRSSTWRVWANKNAADVYLAARTIAGYQKISLHASGDWRHQWVSTETALNITGNENRIIDRWRRPEDQDHGHATGLSIWVPNGHLDVIENDTETDEDVLFLPDAPEGKLAGVHITVSAPDRPITPMPSTLPLGGFVLPANPDHPTSPGAVEAALAFYSQRDITEHDRTVIGEALKRAYLALEAEGRNYDDLMAGAGQGHRIALFAHDDDGIRHVYELSLDQIQVEKSELPTE